MPEDTWETAINPTPSAPAEAPEVQPEAEPTPEAEDPTLETDTPLAAEPPAREGESPEQETQETQETKDEDVLEDDTPEILALPSGSASRKWARRQYHDAAPIRKYLDFETPIEEVGDDLFNRSQSRYAELYDDALTHGPDYAAQKLFGMTAQEVRERLASTPDTPTPTTVQTDQPTDQLFSEAELDQLPWEATERLKAFQEAQARKESELKATIEAQQKRLDALEGKFTSKEQEEAQKLNEAWTQETMKIANDLYSSVLNVVDEGIKSTGLEISKDDPPRIAELKQVAIDLLDKAKIEEIFDADPENKRLVTQVMQAAARRERDVAFREEDNLKVRMRTAFEKKKASPRVQRILSEIESFAGSKPQQKRIPPPPVQGASAGVLPKQPKTWDEAVSL